MKPPNGSSFTTMLLPAAISLAGCAYRVPGVEVPPSMSDLDPASISVADVVVVNAEGVAAPDVVSEEVLAYAEDSLQDARNENAGATRPAAVHLDVTLGDRWMFPVRDMGSGLIFVIAGLAGMKIESEEVTVDVTLRSDEWTFRGRGKANVEGSLYAPARHRALAVAISRALANASAD